MKKISRLLFAVMMLASPLSYASGAPPVGIVTDLLWYEGHHGLLVRMPAMVDPDACGRVDWYILPDSYFRFKEAYGMLLAAKLAGKRVHITVNGCLQGLPQIMHINMVQD